MVIPNGTVYALVLTNLQAADSFKIKYAKDPGIDGKSPDFPEDLKNEFNEMKGFYYATDEMAMAFILQKYNAGVALLKQDSDGNFKALNTKQITDNNGDKAFEANNCE